MIVNPWLFYVMDICSGAKVFAMVMNFLTGFIFCVLFCFFIVAMIDEAKIDKTLETVAKWTLFLFVLFTLLYILIPEKDTILMMQAAKLATTDNVNAIFEALKNAIDYAVSVLS